MDHLQATHDSFEARMALAGTGRAATDADPPAIIRFGVYEADLLTGELRRAGVRIKLQAQPFQVLALLIERPGKIVSRAEIVEKIWGTHTFVDFDQSLGAVIRKLRLALGDSAAVPRYIETIRHKGYRFLLPTHTDTALVAASPQSASPERGHLLGRRKSQPWMRLAATTLVALVFAMWSGRLLRPAG